MNKSSWVGSRLSEHGWCWIRRELEKDRKKEAVFAKSIILAFLFTVCYRCPYLIAIFQLVFMKSNAMLWQLTLGIICSAPRE